MDEPAVTGLALRVPGAHDANSLWELLASGRVMIGDPPAARGLDRRGGYLADIDGFDYRFFNFSERQAAQTDPQQRLMLELVWEALCDAGTPLDQCDRDRVGVFIGSSTHDFERALLGRPDVLNAFSCLGSSPAGIAGGISHAFDLRGPSMTVDTACSSSLSALHLACESLRREEIDLAVVGGINLILSGEVATGLSRMGALSQSGRCLPFAAEADGFVRAEGGIVLILRRREDALRAGDRIHALVAATAMGHDGRRAAAGAPSVSAQAQLMRRALRAGGAAAADLDYVEAFAVGSAIGDAVEMRALAQVFSADRGRRLHVGSAKGNFGHLEAASGLLGIAKVVLQMRHAAFAPTPVQGKLAVSAAGPVVVDRAMPWPAGPAGRVAAVSAFGFGGTNVQVILREPQAPARNWSAAPFLMVSAHSDAGLTAQCHALAARLSREPDAAQPLAANLAFRRPLLARALVIALEPQETLAHRMRDVRTQDIVQTDASAALCVFVPELSTLHSNACTGAVARLPRYSRLWKQIERATQDLADDPLQALLRDAAAQAIFLAHWFDQSRVPVRLYASGNGILAAATAAGLLDPCDGHEALRGALPALFDRTPMALAWNARREAWEELSASTDLALLGEPVAAARVASDMPGADNTVVELGQFLPIAGGKTAADLPVRRLLRAGIMPRFELFAETPPGQIDLPLYPWQRSEIFPPVPRGLEARSADSAPRPFDADRFVYEIVWRESPARIGETPPDRRPWIVVTDARNEALPPVAAIKRSAPNSTIFRVASDWSHVEFSGRSIALADPNWANMLISAMGDCDGVAGLAIALLSAPATELGEAAHALAFASALLSAQIRAARNWRVAFLTVGATRVPSRTTLSAPAGAVWSALAKTLAFEHPQLQSSAVDFSTEAASMEPDMLMASLNAALATGEAQLTVDRSVLWVPRLRPRTEALPASRDTLCRSGSVYLVVGAGDLGMASAEALARAGARRIVLASRSGSASGEHASERLDALRRNGVLLDVVGLDAADRGAVDDFMARFPERPAGIVVCAGSSAGAAIVDARRDTFSRALFAQAAIARNFIEHRADLDFFVVNTAAVGPVGAPEQAPVAAAFTLAEAYAEAVVPDRAAPVIVRWGPWANAGNRQASGAFVSLLDAEKAADLMLALAHAKLGGLLVMPLDLADLIRFYPRAGAQGILQELASGGTCPARQRGYVRGEISTAYAAPETDLERNLAAIWRRLLSIDRVGLHDDFFELGGDSVIAGLILDEVNRIYRTEISTKDAFAKFTIGALGEAIETAVLEYVERSEEEQDAAE